MKEKQKTISKPVSLSGTGLHTGKDVTLTIKPAPENHGYKFSRVDIEGSPVVEAIVDNVVDTSRGTTIEKNGVRIYTIEHVLAALAGLSIDNAMIELDGTETPILDGSSRFYVDAIENAGITELEAYRDFYELKTNVTFIDEENQIEMLALPDKDYKLSVTIDYDTKVLATQHAKLSSINGFKDQIAPSRTFVFLHELEYLLNNNLIKGGDLNNAIVFVNRAVSQEELDRLAKLFNKPTVKVLSEGILNNIELHHPNEPARHKLLDVIGDLALVGKPIKAKVQAYKPGHQSNVKFAKLIKDQMKKEKLPKELFNVDINKEPIYDINDIMKVLPHRPPFLFVDKIIDMSDKHVVGVKNVSMNENFFVGHFPGEPVMPGVLQVEAMAQTGGILALSTVHNPQDYTTYFLKLEDVKYRQKVVPGDTLVFYLELMSPIRRGICHMKGKAYVGNKVVTEATLLAQIVKKNNK